MTIHPVRISGTVVGVPQTYYYFDRMQERIITFVTAHSGMTAARFRQLMSDTKQLAIRTIRERREQELMQRREKALAALNKYFG